MANELQLQVSLNYSKVIGGSTVARSLNESIAVDVSGSGSKDELQSIGTTAEALALGDIATTGFVFLKNLDATNFIGIGDDNSAPLTIKLRPGQFTLLPAGSPLYAKADTATCRLRVVIIEL